MHRRSTAQQKSRPLAKLSRPQGAKILARKRLFAALDAAHAQPVTWITGPAGSGKTTLAASYLDACELRCLWYQVDEGDEDIATFFYYLGLAARQTNPRKQKPLSLFPSNTPTARLPSRAISSSTCVSGFQDRRCWCSTTITKSA